MLISLSIYYHTHGTAIHLYIVPSLTNDCTYEQVNAGAAEVAKTFLNAHRLTAEDAQYQQQRQEAQLVEDIAKRTQVLDELNVRQKSEKDLVLRLKVSPYKCICIDLNGGDFISMITIMCR